MLDTSQEVTVPGRTSSGRTDITIRWPSDKEWADRNKRRKIFIKRLGRGRSETTVDPGDADQRLYEAIKLNGAPPLTVGESTRVIEALAQTDVLDVTLEADTGLVTLATAGGTVHHRLKLPSADQVLAFRRNSTRLIDLPLNTQQIIILLDPAVQLWNDCNGQSDDYAKEIPAVHKDAAIRAVIEALDREVNATADEADF